jgi:hypothetical protein
VHTFLLYLRFFFQQQNTDVMPWFDWNHRDWIRSSISWTNKLNCCVWRRIQTQITVRLLSWRRHQGTMLKNCILILPVSDPAKQVVQVVKHHYRLKTVDRRRPNVSILYCCNCWYNYECIFVIAPWGTLIGITYIVLYCIVLYNRQIRICLFVIVFP